jgi:hypothetical protein
MNDQLIRLRCLELANEYSQSMGELMANADALFDYIEGNDDECECIDCCEPNEGIDIQDETVDAEVPVEVKEAMNALVERLKASGAKGTVVLQKVELD